MVRRMVIGGPRPGMVVEFMHGDQPQLAWVLEEQSGKVRLWTINKRETKMPTARLLPWLGPNHDPGLSRQEIMDRLSAHQEKRGEIQAGLNVMELWDLAQGELEEASLLWFAGLLWEDPDADMMAALGRAMLSAKTHFKFRPPKFEIFDAEKVELRLTQQAEEKEREVITTAGQELLRNLWESRKNGASVREPSMDQSTLESLSNLLKAAVGENLDERQQKIWSVVKKGLPDHPHLALLLAQTWGILPPHHNYLADQAGYHWGDNWAEQHREQIDEQHTRFKAAEQEPEPIDFISIDAATTTDIDDAFYVERHGDGYKLQLALARPPIFWDFGEPLDKDVLARATSVYLPEGSSHMMPEELGTGLFSLHEKQVRPALVTEFILDAEGRTTSITPRTTWIRVAANTTYIAAEEAIAEKTDEHLVLAHELAQHLIARRLDEGASIIRKPEPEVVLEGDPKNPQVRIEEKQPCPEAELLVSEFMILGNCGLALWAQENEIPLLHRTQNIALPADACGIFTDPAEILRTVKLLTPPTLEVQPRRHAALAVPAYAPITSPLRRYTDFINMDQVGTFLEEGAPRRDKDTLEHAIPYLSSRIQAAMQIQRFRPRYWKLVYLARQKKAMFSSIVVEDAGPLICLALPEIQINVRAPRQMLGDKLYPGQLFQVRFGKIDPLSNEIKVVEALEE